MTDNQPYDDRIKLLELYDDLNRAGKQDLLQYAARLKKELDERHPMPKRKSE